MESLNNILRKQPKTRIVFNQKTGKFENFKAKRIPYEDMEPLDEIQVESALSELNRRTRRSDRQKKNQYLPENWNRIPWNEQEFQENFDECIYEQQLTQRLDPGKLTQKPPLEWISEKEATEIFKVNKEAVNCEIREGRLKVLQSAKTSQLLIYLDDAFFQMVFPNSKKTPEEKLHFIQKELKILDPKLKPQNYIKWILPRDLMKRPWPDLDSEKVGRAVLAWGDFNENVFKLFKKISEQDKENSHLEYDDMDVNCIDTLWIRSITINLGTPPLRYFTIEEAAFYLRLEVLNLITAVHFGDLTPMKTGVGEHTIFEKEQLLAYAGPSSDPITAIENSKKTLRWVDEEFRAEFTGTVLPDSESRMFMSEEDIIAERKKIKESFVLLSEVSVSHRAQNLFFFNQLFNPNIKCLSIPQVLRNIKELRLNHSKPEKPSLSPIE